LFTLCLDIIFYIKTHGYFIPQNFSILSLPTNKTAKKTSTRDIHHSNESNLDQIKHDIRKETYDDKMCDLVKNFQRRQTEKLENGQKKSDQKSGYDKPQYFWVPLGTSDRDNNKNPDFILLRSYAYSFEWIKPTEIFKTATDYKFIINHCFKRLKKNNANKILNALKYLLHFDELLSYDQKGYIRFTIKEHPFIIELLEKRLGTISKIPQNQKVKEIMAFIDLSIDIFQLPHGRNWLWLIKVILIDVMKMSELLRNQDSKKLEYTKLVVLLNLMFAKYLLTYEKDLNLCFKMQQHTYNIILVHKEWTVPQRYIEPTKKSWGLGILNMFKVTCILYYRIVIKLNKYIIDEENDTNDMIFKDELLKTYKLAMRKQKENELEDSVLVLYELVDLCHKAGDKFLLCITYAHLSHCFFVLRQTKTAYLYLELICHMGKKFNMVVLEILAHKQLAMIAACQSKYKLSMFHFKRALETSETHKYIKEELVHEIDDIRTCMGQVIAKYKMSHTKLSLEDPLDVDLKCSCTIYQKL
jgi:hypothetical protein